MAKIGNVTGSDYQADFENTEKQGGGGGILPHMYASLQAETIDLTETKDSKGWQAEITFEVLEPAEFTGRKLWAYWTIVHADGWTLGAYKYGKSKFDAFGRAVGEMITEDTDTDELILKPFVAEIGIQIGNKKPDGTFYKDKNQIEKFFYTDDNAKEEVPELGVIGDGTQGKVRNEERPAAANDNRRPAANDNRTSGKPAAAAGGAKKNPWAK